MKTFSSFLTEAFAFLGPEDVEVFVNPTSRERRAASERTTYRGGTFLTASMIATPTDLYVYKPVVEHESVIASMAREKLLTSRSPLVFTGYWEEDGEKTTFVLSQYAITHWSPLTPQASMQLLRAHPQLRSVASPLFRYSETTLDLRTGQKSVRATVAFEPDGMTGQTISR